LQKAAEVGNTDAMHYIKVIASASASLEAAVAEKREGRMTRRPDPGEESQDHILWVEDCPENNFHERSAFEALGLRFTLAVSTWQALKYLSNSKFAAIISDMGRKEGPRRRLCAA
jgi:hypothetical protein